MRTPSTPSRQRATTRTSPGSIVLLSGLIVAVQAIAALYFLVDGIDDVLLDARHGIDWEVGSELLVAFALLAGVVWGAIHWSRMIADAKRNQAALSAARGALAEVIEQRFAEWRLSSAEAEVALFAIKGCSVAEIASMRDAAAGTVRSQLSQIYAKAGVNSQSALISLFIEELLALEEDVVR